MIEPLTAESGSLSSALLYRCRRLLAELDAFRAYFSEQLRKPQLVEMRQLRSNVVSELKSLERLAARQLEAAKLDVSVHSTASSTAAGVSTVAIQPQEKAFDVHGDGGGDIAEPPGDRLLHALRSSNLPFYLAVWTIAKQNCRGVVAFWKKFYWNEGQGGDNGGRKDGNIGRDGGDDDGAVGRGTVRKGLNHGRRDQMKSILVDIVAENGEEWVKVSTISESRLLFKMAEKGWDQDEDSFSEDEVLPQTTLQNRRGQHKEGEDELELVKLAIYMGKAAMATRVRYKHPRIRFVMPKIVEGKIPEIDSILNEIRGYGVIVECGTYVPDVIGGQADQDWDPNSVTSELPLLTLIPNPYEQFTQTLNVDCTLLLALVSDISHLRAVTLGAGQHQAIVRQIELEEQHPLLPTEIWPAIKGHNLVSTQQAAERMREIVDTIGTQTEKERTKILMGDLCIGDLDRNSLLQRFQALSHYEVPENWLIPIEVVDTEPDISAGLHDGRLPQVAHKVAAFLSDINRSVFLYGWVKGIVTVTSNRNVVKQIESMVEDNRNGDDQLEGPRVWICDKARSLAGKEKSRRP